jgi:hypothetical protein
MHPLLLSLVLLSQTEPDQRATGDTLRDYYLQVAKEYAFFRDADQREPLDLAPKPIMRWANDDDWSGDVFLWTHAGRPEVVGCILSGPSGSANRKVFHEFHQTAVEPIGPADLQTRRRWAPKAGLKRQMLEGAPQPATTPAGRLTQMRQLAKEFTAFMSADGTWELRLLPQPLYRWGRAGESPEDGALFGYVWPKGTDLELLLLFESQGTGEGGRWRFAPVRFSNRSLWLHHSGQETWRAESHREPQAELTEEPYTTAYAVTIPRQPDPKPASANEKP